MSFSQPRFSSRGLSIFNAIYDAAKNLDKTELQKLHDKYHTVTVRLGFFCPVSKLASEGQKDAVLLLIELGANPNDAAEGAAMGAKFELVAFLRSQYHINKNRIIFGAAYARKYQYAKKMFYIDGASIESMTCGVIANGDLTFAEQLREQYYIDVQTCVTHAAVAGHSEYVKALCKKYNIDLGVVVINAMIGGWTNYSDFLPSNYQLPKQLLAIASAYSFNGKLSEELRLEHKLDSVDIIRGAICCGDLRRAEELRLALPVHSSHEIFIVNAATYGHINYAKFLRQNLNFSTTGAVIGAVKAGFIRYVYELHKENPTCDKDIVKIAAYIGDWRLLQRFSNKHQSNLKHSSYHASNGGHFNSPLQALHVLSFIDFEEVRNALVGVGTKNIFSEAKDAVFSLLFETTEQVLSENYDSLLPKAKRINQRMRINEFTYNQAQAWDDIGIRIWFLQGISILQQGRLPVELFFQISLWLLSPPAGLDQVEELAQVSFFTNKKLLADTVKKYPNKNTFFNAIKLMQTQSQLCELLQNEIAENKNNIRYQDDLYRYHNRLK